MHITRNIGMLLLAIFLIAWGVVQLLGIGGLGVILALLAIAAGVFILFAGPLDDSVSPGIADRVTSISSAQKKILLLYLIILVLSVYWLLSFFGQSTLHGITHTSRFIDMLSVVIVVLIIIRFLS